MKKCPYCLAEIHEATIVCPHCTSDLMVTVPFRVVSKLPTREQANKRSSWAVRAVLILFILALAASLVIILNVLWNSY